MNRFFYRHIIKDATTNCHLWTGFIDKHGYGLITSDKRCWLAHRLAWVRANGAIPDGLFVLHRCDNPRCVNPEHLFLGTAKDNARDMWAKGRNAPIKRQLKLNAELVLKIRSAKGSHRKIAAKFKVSRSTITAVKSRQTWRHV